MHNWLCKQFIYTSHALKAMISRNIIVADVTEVLKGEVIKDYSDDKPYPSRLLFGFVKARPLHVVIAYNQLDATCIIITAYEPDTVMWNDDFKTKK